MQRREGGDRTAVFEQLCPVAAGRLGERLRRLPREVGRRSVGNRADHSPAADLGGNEAGSVISGTVEDYDADYDLTRLKFSGGELLIPGRFGDVNTALRLRVRANDVSLCRNRPNDSSILNIIPITVDEIHLGQGPYALVRLRAGQDFLMARLTRRSCDELRLKSGDQLLAQIKSVAVRSTLIY